jgi:hypothetical protein
VANIRLTWDDPVVREDGSALATVDIASVEVAMKVGGAPEFTAVGSVLPDVMYFEQTDLPPGDYEFRVTVVDKQIPPRSSASVTVAINVPVPIKAAPGAVTGLAAEVLP